MGAHGRPVGYGRDVRGRARGTLAGLCFATALALLAPACAAHAQQLVDLTGEWRGAVGDEPAWAAPDFDDASWSVVAVPDEEASALPDARYVWYRRTVEISPEARATWGEAELGIGLGLTPGSTAYDVFVDGERVGSRGVLDGDARVAPNAPLTAGVEFSAVEDGRVVVALRVWQPAIFGQVGAEQPRWTSGAFLLGPRALVEARSEAAFGDYRTVLTVYVTAGLAMILIALLHLLVWRGRRDFLEYAWFGVFVGALGLQHVASVQGEDVWPYYALTTSVWLNRLAFGFTSAFAWEFFLRFYGIRRPRWFWMYWVFCGFEVVWLLTDGWHGLGWLGVVSSGVQYAIVVSMVIVLAVRRGRAERIVAVGMIVANVISIHRILTLLDVIPALFDPYGPADAALSLSRRLVAILCVAYALSEKLEGKLNELDRSHAASQRFVPAAFLQLLGRRAVTDVERGDSVARVMTVMFADIRGFTTLSERFGAEKTFAFMNEYHAVMEPAIGAEGGFINQIYGDGIMALFETPDAAARAALAMRSALETFNETHEPIDIGIGVHTGEVMLGTIGGKERLDTGVISDAVNTASRIQELTKEHGRPILLSGAAVEALEHPDALALEEVATVTPKGRRGEVTLFAAGPAAAHRR